MVQLVARARQEEKGDVVSLLLMMNVNLIRTGTRPSYSVTLVIALIRNRL